MAAGSTGRSCAPTAVLSDGHVFNLSAGEAAMMFLVTNFSSLSDLLKVSAVFGREWLCVAMHPFKPCPETGDQA